MTKKRISLTLDEGLVRRADRLVGRLSESRSGVFEELLGRAFVSMSPKTAVVLAGDAGVLLREFGGRTLVDRHVENLTIAGVNRIAFVGGGLGPVREHLGGDARFTFIDDQGAGTAGAVVHAKHLVNGPFFVVYGDTIASIDYTDLYRFHTDQKVMTTVALTTWDEPQKFGVPQLKGTKVTGFREKPAKSDSYLVAAGSFVMEPEVLELVHGGTSSLEKSVLPKLSSIGQLAGYVFSGGWLDVGSEKSPHHSQGSE
jgi:NDP-sugar pyrophosphorylase family protein